MTDNTDRKRRTSAVTRRGVLGVVGTVGATALAGCNQLGGSSDGSDSGDGSTDDPIETFEDGTLSEYSGDKRQFELDSGSLVETLALSGTNADEYSAHCVTSRSGLTAYPAQGDSFSCYVYHDRGNVHSALLFGVQDTTFNSSGFPDDSYGAQYHTERGQYEIVKRSGGSRSTLASIASQPQRGQWLEYAVDWTSDGTITFTVYRVDSNRTRTAEIGSTSTTDDEYLAGGIGFVVNDVGEAGTDVGISYDHVHFRR